MSLPEPKGTMSTPPNKPDKLAPPDLASVIILHQLWFTIVVLLPAYAIWHDGDEFAKRVILPVLFAFGAVPILFSAAYNLRVVEMPANPVKIFGSGMGCKRCGGFGVREASE